MQRTPLLMLIALAAHALPAASAQVGGQTAAIGPGRVDLGQPRRCGTPERDPLRFNALAAPAGDCDYNSTNPTGAYAPSFIYDIPVVVHVIERTNGVGSLSVAQVQSQIDVLNEDFRALAGSNGAPGFDTMIQFHLATVDPNGQPTTGITNSVNNTWFNDGGQYWNTLAWDTNRYLNIYTNNGGGALGYVPDIPQSGTLVGTKRDRVVVLHSAFGLTGSAGAPFDLGRTATHEVGHYLGLFHTFDGGCGTVAGCNSTGDTICDTNRQSSPTFGCPSNATSCGGTAPFHNYMDYSDDRCMYEFTSEQTRRMRCTLEFWRPDLAQAVGTCGTPAPYCTAGTSASGCQASIHTAGTPSASAAAGFSLLASGVEGQKDGLFFYGSNGRQANPWGNGSSFQCVVPPVLRAGLLVGGGTAGSCNGSFSQDLNALWCPTCPRPAKNPGPGATVQAQLWYRDPASTSNQTTSLSDAVEFTVCP